MTFQLTLAEFKAFQNAVARRGGPGSNLSRHLILPFAAIFVVIQTAIDPRTRARFALDPTREVMGIAPYFVGVVLFFVLFTWLIRRKNENSLLRTPLLSAPVSVSFDETGVTSRDSESQTTMLWRAIHSVFQTSDLIVIMAKKNAGLIVPKRAFATPDEANTFFQRAEQLWCDHHPDAPPIPKP